MAEWATAASASSRLRNESPSSAVRYSRWRFDSEKANSADIYVDLLWSDWESQGLSWSCLKAYFPPYSGEVRFN